MTVHNYRSRQVHETLNGVNPSSGFRDMRSAKSGPNLWQIWQVFGPWASPYGANGQMSMTVHNYRPRQFHRTSNGENPSSGYRDMGSASLAAARPTARPPGPWRQYPSSPEGWGVKRCDRRTNRQTNRQTDWLTIHRRLVTAKNIINEFYHTDLHSTSYPVDSMRCCRLVGWKVPTNFEVGKDQCNLHWTLPSENKANLRDLIAATGLVILLKLDSNHQLFSPCDLEIWWMTFLEQELPGGSKYARGLVLLN